MSINKKDTDDNILEEEKNLSFIEKFKTSKKFRAKLELIGYGILILVLVIYANFASISNSNYNYTKENNVKNTVNNLKDNNLYASINDSYNADINVSITKGENTINREYEVDKNKDTIVKKIDDNTEYKLSDTDEFYNMDNILVSEKEIFDLVSYKYLDFDNIKKYINKGVVDYTTKYSSGVELISYKVMVRDIMLDNTTEEYITINITSEKDKITLDIDYTNLLKNDVIDSCNVKIVYTNINTGEIVGEE